MEITDKIREQFGSWLVAFTPFIQSSEMDNIYKFLKGEASKDKVIIPKSADTYKSLQLCDKSKLKAVVVLMDPYPSMKDGKMISNGIPMDTSNTGVTQSSLSMWYHGIEDNYGFNAEMDIRNDISYLLTEEHVLLINSAMSVEMSKSGSHAEIWKPFMNHLFKVLNEEHKGLPIVLCGTAAQRYEKEISPMLHYIKKIEHPVAAIYANRKWENGGMFKWVNEIIRQNNGNAEMINWIRYKGAKTPEDAKYPEWVRDNNLPSAQSLNLPWND